MGKMLLGFAAGIAAAVVAAPAGAGGPDYPFVSVPNNGTVGFNGNGVHIGIGPGSDHRFDRRGRGDVSTGIWVNGGEWARHNNQGFKSDSYNDWWHDQPWRSQPAWVRNNQSCRTYWSGGGWRC